MAEKKLSNLKILLLECDKPQYIVAAKCGIHPSQLSRYALGQDRLRGEHLRKLCRYFKVSQQYMSDSTTFQVDALRP